MNNRICTVMAACAAVLAGSSLAVAQDPEMHVSTAAALKAATNKVEPYYPSVARQLKLQGEVHVEAHILEDGSVETVTPLTGNAVLMDAAVRALKLWKFVPFTEGGKPVRAVAPLQFTFRM